MAKVDLVRTGYRMYRAARTGYKMGKMLKRAWSGSDTQTKKRYKSGGGGGVTVQHDVNTQYRKKRMPRRKVKKWRKFVKKVEAVSDKLKKLRSVVLNSGVQCDIVGANQDWAIVHLYGGSGVQENPLFTKETGTRDLVRIIEKDDEIGDTVPGGLNTAASVHFESAVLDLTFSNNSSELMEVDVYKVVYGYNEKDMSSFAQIIASGQMFSSSIAPGGTTCTLDKRGVTPFSLGGLISAGKVKILSKRKYLLGAGQAATLQHRDPRNRWASVNDLVQNFNGDPSVSDFTYKKFTVSFLFVAKFMNAGAEDAGSLVVRATRSYNYKIETRPQNTYYNEYITY